MKSLSLLFFLLIIFLPNIYCMKLDNIIVSYLVKALNDKEQRNKLLPYFATQELPQELNEKINLALTKAGIFSFILEEHIQRLQRKKSLDIKFVDLPDNNTGHIKQLELSPNGNLLCIILNNGTLVMLSLRDSIETQTLFSIKLNDSEQDNIESVKFSADQDCFIITRNDQESVIFDTYTGKEIAQLKNSTNSSYAEFSPDGNFIATVSGSTANIYNKRGNFLYKINVPNLPVKFSCFGFNNKFILSTNNAAYVYSLSNITFKKEFELAIPEPGMQIVSAKFTKDSKYITLTFETGEIYIYKIDPVNLQNTNQLSPIKMLSDHRDYSEVSFNLDGNKMLTYSCDCTAQVYDFNNITTSTSNEPLFKIDDAYELYDYLVSGCYNPDESLIALGCKDQYIHCYNAHTGKPLIKLPGHNNWSNFLKFNNAGILVTLTEKENQFRLYDLTFKKLKKAFSNLTPLQMILLIEVLEAKNNNTKLDLAGYYDLHTLSPLIKELILPYIIAN